MDEYVEKYIKMISDGCTLSFDNSRYEELYLQGTRDGI